MQRTRKNGHSRRKFLEGLGLTGLALPLVPLLESQAGGVGGYPQRFIAYCTTTGMTGRYPNNWSPTGTESDFTLGPILEPLTGGYAVDGLSISDFTDQCNFFQGINMPSFYDSANLGGHQRGMGVALTARPLVAGADYVDNEGRGVAWPTGISVDQHIANAIGQETPFSSLELGVRIDSGVSMMGRLMSYAGPSQPVPVEGDPYAVFDRLFADLTVDPAELDRLRVERQSVIDFVYQDVERFSTKIAAADKRKLDAHLEAIRSIEQRLANGVGAGCVVPDLQPGVDPMNNNNFPVSGRMQIDLMVAALACGVTNVASLLWGGAAFTPTFTWVPGVSMGNHGLSHADPNDDNAQDQGQACARWQTEQFAYLLQRLSEIPEGSGTLLDNTLVLWFTENAQSNTHSANNMPYVLAGAGGGSVQTGRFLTYSGVPHNRMMVSLCQAFGLPDTQFGDPRYGSGGLAGLL